MKDNPAYSLYPVGLGCFSKENKQKEQFSLAHAVHLNNLHTLVVVMLASSDLGHQAKSLSFCLAVQLSTSLDFGGMQ